MIFLSKNIHIYNISEYQNKQPYDDVYVWTKILQTNFIDGSAYLEQGNTKVLAAVYGPREPTQRSGGSSDEVKINCQFSMAVFSTSERKKRPRGDRKSQEMSQHLRQTFEAAIKTVSINGKEYQI